MKADLTGLALSWQNLFHQYNDPPAVVGGTFSDRTSLSIHLGPAGTVHAVVRSPNGRAVQTKAQARQVPLPAVRVLPQVAPLAQEEIILREEYVRANISSYLAPQHFRNQLKFHHEHFQAFKELVESTWLGLQIQELQNRNGLPGEPIGLLVRDGDFVAEVAWMGHGLQMWLQTMWFVVRTSPDSTVVLDEPDVYMHPDLQRKLLRFLRRQFSQVIVATHSTELLSEAEPRDVLVIDRSRRRSRFATDLPAVQRILADIGSVQNIALTRLWTARRLIMVEGEDLPFLKRFHQLLYPDATVGLDAVPTIAIGGWTGWPYAVGSNMLLTNAGGEEITSYCILDSDYHTPQQVQSRKEEAAARGVQLHIWEKKEIENYLVRDDLLHRVIVKRTPSHLDPPARDEVANQLDLVCDELRDRVTDGFAQEFLNDDRAGGLPAANRAARAYLDAVWETREGRLGVVSGKQILSSLSRWSQEHYEASFGVKAVLDELVEDELNQEVRHLIDAIETGAAL